MSLNIVLFDTPQDWANLLPLTATRAIADCKIGILTIKDKWRNLLQTEPEILTQAYLQVKYKHIPNIGTIYVNAKVLPSANLLAHLEKLQLNGALVSNEVLVAFRSSELIQNNQTISQLKFSKQETIEHLVMINYPWDIFLNNGNEIKKDIQLLDLKPNPEALSATNILIGKDIYVGKNVRCEVSVLNSNDGPIYLDDDTEVMEGCTVRAPFYLGKHSTLKMQAKIYGDTSIGEHCKIGGEVSNSVIFGYSNKAHDGFLGNSVLAEWCNLGADTNNSNLKNNYGKIKVWNYPTQDYINSGLQFSGLIMGDHSKAAINTQFNTGTVVGVCANVFDAGFSAKFIPDFSWGRNAEFALETAYQVTQRVMERRHLQLSEIDKSILKHIFETTMSFRKFI